MKTIIKLLSIILLFSLISCSTKEEIVSKNTLDGFMIKDTIVKIVYNTSSWRAVDKFYRENIGHSDNSDIVNHTIFWMTLPNNNFFEETDRSTIEYYLNEAKGIDFNINLRLLVAMLREIDPYWNDSKMESYSKFIYEKNTKFWADNFPGQTVYLEKNAEPLVELLTLSKSKDK